MIHHIKGRLVEKNPTYAVIEAGGVGYFINISLNTFSKIGNNEECKLLTHLSIKEDAHTLYGFAEAGERDIFRLLISVNGVGASTARVMLSSLTSDEISTAILTGDVTTLKGIKGIGAKTAQRVIVDLKDKVGKDGGAAENILSFANNTNKDEALSALLALGFTKNAVEKVLNQVLKAQSDLSVEDIIKESLKKL